jgi:hypothetical protein
MTATKGKNTVIAGIRWSARILGVIMAAFLLLMFFGYFVEGRNPSFDSLSASAAFGLVMMAIYVLAMFLALKWEPTGALLGAVALGVFFAIMFLGLLPGNVSGGFSPRGVLNPVFLTLWLPILLYFTCRRLEK